MKKGYRRKLRRLFARFGLRFCSLIIKFLSLKNAYFVAKVFSKLGYLFATRQKRIALEGLKIAFGNEKALKELKDIITSSNFSRFPVYSNDIFNITSTIHCLNILGVDDNEKIGNYTEKLYIVPTSKPVVQILSELKRNRKYMAIVVDEFGVPCGIITIEDIIKKIVGDITEQEENQKDIESNGNEDIFEAKMDLKEFYEKTGIDFTDEKVSTLNGIINLALGRIGRKNEKVIYKGVKFEIIDTTDKSVKLIKLLKK